MSTSSASTLVILLNYNNESDTMACVHSLIKCKGVSDVFVLDNSESEERYFILKDQLARMEIDCEVVNSGSNLGFAKGVNIGIRKALNRGFKYAWVLNNDCIVEESSLVELIGVLESNDEVIAAGSLIKTVPRGESHTCGGGQYHPFLGVARLCKESDSEIEKDYISGASMAINIGELFSSVGFFDEQFFMYWEDVDLGLRINKAGFKCVFVRDSIVYHKLSSSLGTEQSGRRSYLFEKYFFCSYVKFLRKHHSVPVLAIIFHLIARPAKYLLRGDFTGARISFESMLAEFSE